MPVTALNYPPVLIISIAFPSAVTIIRADDPPVQVVFISRVTVIGTKHLHYFSGTVAEIFTLHIVEACLLDDVSPKVAGKRVTLVTFVSEITQPLHPVIGEADFDAVLLTGSKAAQRCIGKFHFPVFVRRFEYLLVSVVTELRIVAAAAYPRHAVQCVIDKFLVTARRIHNAGHIARIVILPPRNQTGRITKGYQVVTVIIIQPDGFTVATDFTYQIAVIVVEGGDTVVRLDYAPKQILVFTVNIQPFFTARADSHYQPPLPVINERFVGSVRINNACPVTVIVISIARHAPFLVPLTVQLGVFGIFITFHIAKRVFYPGH